MSTTIEQPQPARSTDVLDECDAMIVALASQRTVIIRRDQKIPLWSADQICRPVRALRRGESVYYKGERDVVRAISVY